MPRLIKAASAKFKAMEVDHGADLDKEVQAENAVGWEPIIHGTYFDYEALNGELTHGDYIDSFCEDELGTANATDPAHGVEGLRHDAEFQ